MLSMTDDRAERLKWARARAGFDSPRSAAKHFRWNENTHKAREGGLRDYGVDEAKEYARAFKVSWVWLLSGEGTHERKNIVPIVGLVGLGEEVDYQGNGEADLGRIELPFPVPPDCFGLEARGESQFPRIKSGEVIVGRWSMRSPEEHLGREAIVKVLDGPYLIKTIRRGTEPGRFHLESHNAPLREDVEIERVGDVLMILPSRTWVREAS